MAKTSNTLLLYLRKGTEYGGKQHKVTAEIKFILKWYLVFTWGLFSSKGRDDS